MANKGITIHHVYRAQCLDDGTAYFGCISHEDPEFGRDGNIPLNFGKKLQEKIAKHGRHRFAVQIWFSSPLREEVLKRWHQILKETRNHPLSLNETDDERSEALKAGIAASDYFPDEAHRQAHSDSKMGNQHLLGHVHTEEARAKISAARKRMKWIHNKETDEERQLEVGEAIPEGFEFGRLRGIPSKGSKVETLKKLPKFALDAYAKRSKKLGS